MKFLIKFLWLAAFCFGLAQPAQAGPKRLIDELFVLLPERSPGLEGTPKELIAWFRRGVLDTKNGFMSLEGDGAQCSLQAALFRFPDGKPLLAVAHGGDSDDETFTSLSFYTEGKDGERMVPVDHAIFPVADGGELHFFLPRQGRTVLVKNGKDKVVAQATWNGTKFELGE